MSDINWLRPGETVKDDLIYRLLRAPIADCTHDSLMDEAAAEIRILRRAIHRIAASGDEGTQDAEAPEMWKYCIDTAKAARQRLLASANETPPEKTLGESPDPLT